MYDKIAVTDFRHRTFIHPDKLNYYKYRSVRVGKLANGKDDTFMEDSPAYKAIKFRAKAGNWETYSIGAIVDVPVMRIEEMYFIEAEAVGASKGVAAGVAKLNSFMQSYRQSDYSYTTADLRSFQIEVLTQMRIEFWGEGNAFPSAKRIKPDIIQNYEGTNAPGDIFKINMKGIKP